jgi:hypothetical protein
MELKMIKTTADDMHFYLSNIETGKFSDLILPNDNPPDLGQGGRQGSRRDPHGARDETQSCCKKVSMTKSNKPKICSTCDTSIPAWLTA